MKSVMEWGFIVVAAAVLIFSSVEGTKADTGDRNATRVAAGNLVSTRRITLPSGAATQIIPSRLDRPDETCYNNSAVVIWLSSNVTNAQCLAGGFPIASSTTFMLRSLSSSVYACPDSGASEVRCFDGITQ